MLLEIIDNRDIALGVGVKILLENSEGKFLLVRRSAKLYPEAGSKWDLIGGRIVPGTPLIENLEREVFEETGLKIIGEPKLVAAQDILRIVGKHVVRLLYIGRADGIPKISDEHESFQWATRDELITVEPIDIYLKELITRRVV